MVLTVAPTLFFFFFFSNDPFYKSQVFITCASHNRSQFYELLTFQAFKSVESSILHREAENRGKQKYT